MQAAVVTSIRSAVRWKRGSLYSYDQGLKIYKKSFDASSSCYKYLFSSALEKGLVTLFVLPKLLLHDGSEVIRVI